MDTTTDKAAAAAKVKADADAKAKAEAEASAKAEAEAKAKAEAEARAKAEAERRAAAPKAKQEIRFGRKLVAAGEPLPDGIPEEDLAELRRLGAI